MHFNTYGLAWWVTDYRGRKVVDHGGGIDGMRAHIAFMPEENIGLVALSNGRPNNLVVALKYLVFDRLLGGAATDWSRSMLNQHLETVDEQKRERDALEADRVANTDPSRPLIEYVGNFGDVYFGVAAISQQEGTLHLSLGGKTTGRLEHWHYDVFRFLPDNPASRELFLSFRVNAVGIVDRVEIEGLADFARQ
jgi:hypothetical protein